MARGPSRGPQGTARGTPGDRPWEFKLSNRKYPSSARAPSLRTATIGTSDPTMWVGSEVPPGCPCVFEKLLQKFKIFNRPPSPAPQLLHS